MPAGSLKAISGYQRCVQLPGLDRQHLRCVSTQLSAKEGTGWADGLARNSGAQIHGW